MRAFDWSATPLGSVEAWPQSLRTAVSIMLASRFPMLVLWGRDYIQLYNDAYRPVLGATKHPAALGQRAQDCWPEIWDGVLAPMFGAVMSGGEPIWNEDLAFHLDRNGYLEETFFTFSYSAVRDESGSPGGVLVTCVETTERVLGERRLKTLRELASTGSGSQFVDAACRSSAAVLARNPHDVPFAAIYLFGPGRQARLAGCAGVEPGDPAAPLLIGLAPETAAASPWRLDRVASTGRAELAPALTMRGPRVPGGPWPEPADAAAIVPIAHSGREQVLGALVAGISPRRAYDAAYQGFLELIAAQIATAVGNARAYESERERAEALAEIDRAKTAFFSNVSHEFRTPLTLMLGPTEAALASPGQSLQGGALAMVHRNQLRLLKLVNALLDFSRFEAGRAQASYRQTDIAALTGELAGAFRSAIEHAGLRFDVSCEAVDVPVYVDRDMWEKVVLNLLSNALKFTFAGSIRVHQHRVGDVVELSVSDTGAGIPEDQLTRIFERFHRVEGTVGRTHEGSGIGLALTQELVRLHGGTIRVVSRPGEGTTFTVRIPTGSAHLPAERIEAAPVSGGATAGTAPFVEEALRWIPEDGAVAAEIGARERPSSREPGSFQRILLADDNADMREYVRQLLHDWPVTMAKDGGEALVLARRMRPDLLITDVMMPGMDGFEVLRELRADAATRSIPVLMLSARAGEDARITGFEAGAEDYLTKPFSGRELVARVKSLLALSRARQDAELQKEHLRSLFMQAPTPILILTGEDLIIELANPLACQVWGRQEGDVLGRPLLDALPELRQQAFADLLRGVLHDGTPYVGKEMPAHVDRRGTGALDTIYFNFVYAPLRAVDGRIEGVLVIAFDVTDEVTARDEMNRLREAAEEASRAKDAFLAMLGHELRNPLAPILTALQLMNLRGDAVAGRERIVIDRQVRHLTRLVDDLLDVSRITQGKIELRREPVEIAEIVTAALEGASPLFRDQEHDVAVAVPASGLAVNGDVTRLTQIVTNLLTNAAKFTPPRGRIAVAADREGREVVLRVSDTGVGIAPDMLPRVFEMFAQGSQTLDRARGGLGLGLTIVHSLIGLHGGSVEARSDGVGAGSEFVVRLPALSAGAAAGAAASQPGDGALRARTGARVLVVDDNVDAAHLIADALAAVGHRTHVAFDGRAALDAAAAFQPDAALLDLGLPMMDGYELARQLRDEQRVSLLIAVTGYGQLSDYERTRAAGFDAHLVKPVDVGALTSLLDALLAARDAAPAAGPTGPSL